MNYSYQNYQNPYGGGYGSYQQPIYQQPVQQPTQKYLPLTFVNGIEGAKAFIVNPNQTYYLIDDDSNTLYVKSADNLGKPSLKTFKIKAVEYDEQGHIKEEMYATKEELNSFVNSFSSRLNNLTEKIEKTITGQNSGNFEGVN